jgi:hypothetical protein
VQDYISVDTDGKLPVLPLPEDLYTALEASASKQGKTAAHLATQVLRGYVS